MGVRQAACQNTRSSSSRFFRGTLLHCCPRQQRGKRWPLEAGHRVKAFKPEVTQMYGREARESIGRERKRVATLTVQALQGHATSPGGTLFTTIPALLVAACTAIVFLATVVICMFLLIRPLLKRLESLAVACESAAKEVEKASVEFALASVVINNDLPTTLDSMERASLEFEELGQSLNGLTGVLRRTKPTVPRPGVPGKGEDPPQGEGSDEQEAATAGDGTAAVVLTEMSAVEAIQASTINSMRKVAHDVSALAAALSPAMVAWRRRLGFLTERFDTASKPDQLKELPLTGDHADSSAGEDLVGIEALQAAQSTAGHPEESSQEESWDEEVQTLQDRVMSQAEHGEVGSVANELAKAATEVADVARASLASTDEDQAADLGLSPEAHQEGTNLLEKAAKAAEALTREAQKAAEVESKFKALKDIAPPEDSFQPIDIPSVSERNTEGLGDDMEDRRHAAQAVFAALANAEEAASAAAAASGALEDALQKAEQQAGVSWWGWGGGSLFRSSPKKPRIDTVEAQEHDGMAYPCSRYIASREGKAASVGDVSTSNAASSQAGKS